MRGCRGRPPRPRAHHPAGQGVMAAAMPFPKPWRYSCHVPSLTARARHQSWIWALLGVGLLFYNWWIAVLFLQTRPLKSKKNNRNSSLGRKDLPERQASIVHSLSLHHQQIPQSTSHYLLVQCVPLPNVVRTRQQLRTPLL